MGSDSSASAYANLDAMLQARAEKFASLPAFTCLGHTLSYRQLAEYSDTLAAWLRQESGLQPGDRVAIQLPNLLQYPVIAWAVLKAGMVLVNINPMYTASELRKQLQHSEVRMLFVLANFAGIAASIIADTKVEQVVVTEVADLHPAPKRQLLNYAIRYLKRLVPAYHFPRQHRLRNLLKRGKALTGRSAPPVQSNHESLALLQYTGGTTGQIKAAMLSHGNLLSNLSQVDRRFAGTMPGRGAVMVSPLPLYHIYAFAVGFLNAMLHGHHVILIPNPKDLRSLVAAVRPYRMDGILGINTLYRLLLDNEDFCRLDFSRLKVSGAGGMALSVDIARRWQELTGCPIIDGYGLSECSPLLACNINADMRLGTAGRLLPETSLLLLGRDGRPVAVGEPGEICVKGPQVMQGYWHNGSADEEAFDAEGWFHTGDIGTMDEDGYLRIVDRLKDVIIVSGFNVYPNELEDHVCSHPHIQDACAIAVGDEFSVQIKLFVVRRHEQLTETEVIEWCRQSLASYKVPRMVEFRSHLPKSNVGKVLRRELREEAEQTRKNS